MASENARRFELRLGKLGFFILICSMSGMLFAAFLFGVVVGSDLENYPETIARRAPIRFLEWVGLLETEKTKPVAVVIKNEKPIPREVPNAPEAMAPSIVSTPAPVAEKAEPYTPDLPLAAQPARETPSVTLPEKAKNDAVVKPSSQDKQNPGGRYLVQITSCKNKKVAEEVIKDLGKIGYKPHIVMVNLKEKGVWYRVILTDLVSREKAQEAAKKIDLLLKGNKSVVQIQKK